MMDSRIGKALGSLNQAMGLPRNHYTFHAFRCSGATLAYKNRVSIQDIQQHGTLTLDCVWRYIAMDMDTGLQVASSFQCILPWVF